MIQMEQEELKRLQEKIELDRLIRKRKDMEQKRQ